MRDIEFACYAAILRNLLVQRVEQQVGLIAFAHVAAIKRGLKVGGGLGVVVSAAIDIVYEEADAQALAGIHGEFRLEVILAVSAVAAVVV